MTRVDFYILPESGDRERFTCELAGKIRRQDLGLHIHTASPEAATKLDTLLWTFKDTSFLPHSLLEDAKEEDKLTIACEGYRSEPQSVLINLGDDIPAFADNFERVVEIVPPQENHRQQARQRYKQYRDAGFDLHNHDLSSGSEAN